MKTTEEIVAEIERRIEAIQHVWGLLDGGQESYYDVYALKTCERDYADLLRFIEAGE